MKIRGGRMNQLKKISFVLLLWFSPSSCSESFKSNTEGPQSENLPEVVTSVVIFGNPETGNIFNTSYRTQFLEDDSLENCLFYELDSVVWRSGERNYVNMDFEAGYQSFCTTKSNDTLYINFKATPPADKSDQLKYCLLDSIDIHLKTQQFRIYSYENIDEDPRWDETLYFSNELGFVYSHYPFFKKKYELIAHSSVDDTELTIIKDSLKVRSGELNKTDVDSKKKHP
jgi:hypothetical protein